MKSKIKKLLSIFLLLFILVSCNGQNEILVDSSVEETDEVKSASIENIEETDKVEPASVENVGETNTVEPASVKNIEETDAVEPTSVENVDLTELWSYGLTSIRTGEPLIEEGKEHQLDESLISYGYNLVVDEHGNILAPRATPLQGGEQLILVDEYQNDHNMREYAHVYTIMAPIRDTILYHFEETTQEEWLAITEILSINNIKIEDASELNGRSILSTEQVYDYIASGNAEGSPVIRYLEEAGLELKCLAFKEFDFTNPEGNNHCTEHNIDVGSGIKLP